MGDFKKLLRFLKPYRRDALFAFAMLVLMVAFDLAIPRLLGLLIDKGIRPADMKAVLAISAIMLGLSLASAGVAILNNNSSIRVGEGIARDLREALFLKVLEFSSEDMDRYSTGTLMVRMSGDVSAIQRFFQILLRIGSRAPLTMAGSIVLMVVTSPVLALSMLPLMLACGLVIMVFSAKMEPLFLSVQQKMDILNTVLQENIAGARLVKAFVRADREGERFSRANTAFTSDTIRVMRAMAAMSPILTFLVNIGVVLVVLMGGKQAAESKLSLGQIVAFTNYLLATLHPLVMMIQLSNTFANGMVSTSRLLAVLDTEPSIRETDNPAPVPGSLRSDVRFSNVGFHYDGDSDRPVLENVNLLVREGGTTAILGATGAGKSSLLNLIPRSCDASSGCVEIGGIDVRNMSLARLRKMVGVVPQESILFSGTVRENICYGRPDATDEEVIAAAKAAQAHEFIMALPRGYDSRVGERGVNLSGGQKQRIAIARALLPRPSIILLDDATSSVDVETEVKIRRGIEAFTKSATKIVVAQRISTVLDAEHIAVLEEGRIVAEGTHRDLLESSPVYREIYDSQLGAGLKEDNLREERSREEQNHGRG
jgi:ATP-binding cassette subfamily B protein